MAEDYVVENHPDIRTAMKAVLKAVLQVGLDGFDEKSNIHVKTTQRMHDFDIKEKAGISFKHIGKFCLQPLKTNVSSTSGGKISTSKFLVSKAKDIKECVQVIKECVQKPTFDKALGKIVIKVSLKKELKKEGKITLRKTATVNKIFVIILVLKKTDAQTNI